MDIVAALIGAIIIFGGGWAAWSVISNLDKAKDNRSGGIMLSVIAVVLITVGIGIIAGA